MTVTLPLTTMQQIYR